MIQIRRFGSLAAIIVFSMVLAACGLGGDDDEEPTPTLTPEDASLNAESTDPTSTPDDPFVLVTSTAEEESSTPDIPDATGPGATIVADEQTPEAATPASTEDPEAGNGEEELSTPAAADPDSTEVTGDAATPSGGDGVGETPEATTAPNVGTGSDGTSGPQEVPSEDATPADDSESSPAPNVNAIEVDSCDVVEVPPYAGSGTEFLTTEDVNFRVGPGSDCASVLDGPLGPNVAVEVVGGPVVRADDPDGTLWVQVIVGDESGWIAQDFLEAVEPE